MNQIDIEFQFEFVDASLVRAFETALILKCLTLHGILQYIYFFNQDDVG